MRTKICIMTNPSTQYPSKTHNDSNSSGDNGSYISVSYVKIFVETGAVPLGGPLGFALGRACSGFGEFQWGCGDRGLG
jgi:hypothetical protein